MNRYRLIDDRVGEILALNEAIAGDKTDWLTSRLVLATEGSSSGNSSGPKRR